MIAPTTPIGSRTTSEFAISSVQGKSATTETVASAAITGRPAWPMRAKEIGAPMSALIVAAISSERAWSPAAMRRTTAARSAGSVAAQAGNAAVAAATAWSTSSAVPAGTVAMTASVAGLTTSITGPPKETALPSIQWAGAGKLSSLLAFMRPRVTSAEDRIQGRIVP